MRKNNGDLHFFINGRDQGKAASDTADVIYGVVDLYGMAVQVSIVERRQEQQAVRSRTAVTTAAERRTATNLNYLRRLAEQELPHVFERKGFFLIIRFDDTTQLLGDICSNLWGFQSLFISWFDNATQLLGIIHSIWWVKICGIKISVVNPHVFERN